MKRLSILILVAGLITSVTACEEKEHLEAFASLNQMTQSLCELTFRCCSTSEAAYMLGPFVTAENCSQRLLDKSSRSSNLVVQLELLMAAGVVLPNPAALEVAVEDGRTRVDQTAYDECVDHLLDYACNVPEPTVVVDEGCVAPEPEPETFPCDPAALFVGIGGSGDRCSSAGTSYECKPGFKCVTSFQTGVDGQCVEAGKIGELCFASDECDANLYCSMADGTCQAFRNEGEPCVFYDREDLSPDAATALIRCRTDLSCDPITKMCVAQCQRGAACGSDLQCDDAQEIICISNRCDRPRGAGLPCNSDVDCEETLRCEPSLEDPNATFCVDKLDEGEICAEDADCVSAFCEAFASMCAPTVAAGGLCPSDRDEECADGICENEGEFCTADTDCTRSGSCDLDSGFCISYCLGLKPDGAECESPRQCASDGCVSGFCRSLPLAAGQDCDGDWQCDSGFCSRDIDEPKCMKLPLALGEGCDTSSQCKSRVCFDSDFNGDPACVQGLGEGEPCVDPDQPPCTPNLFYCDSNRDPAVCTPLKETGELCDSSLECRGSCEVRFGRMLCTAAAKDDTALCDGI